jgi:hypothetical protein
MEKQEYVDRFSEVYNAADFSEYGSANITALEIAGLRQLVQEARETFPDNKELSRESRVQSLNLRRTYIVNQIKNQGFPSHNLVTAERLADAANKHGCVVAEDLAAKRGPDGALATFESYTTKDRFDRFVQDTLFQKKIFQNNPNLYQEWQEAEARETEVLAPVRYPKNVDSNKVYGISRPKRFLPSQLMKDLENYRLNPNTTSDVSIYWEELEPVLENAECLMDITVGIPIAVVDQLLAKGPSGPDDSEIVSLLLSGYSPTGPIKEHGCVEEVRQIWQAIITGLVYDNEGYARGGARHRNIAEQLVDGVNQKMKALPAKNGEQYGFNLVLE